MDRLEDMFHLVIQKKDSEIQGFKKTVNEMKLKIAGVHSGGSGKRRGETKDNKNNDDETNRNTLLDFL